MALGLNADGTPKAAGARRLDPAVLAGQVTMSVESEDMGGGIARYALNLKGNVSFTGI